VDRAYDKVPVEYVVDLTPCGVHEVRKTFGVGQALGEVPLSYAHPQLDPLGKAGQPDVDLHLLGMYDTNGHLSIRNYFEYCGSELPSFLPGWKIIASKPGRPERRPSPGAHVGKLGSAFENYIEWPMQLRRFHAGVFHIVDQGIAWYRSFLGQASTVVTVHDLISIMMMRQRLNLGSIPRLRRLKMNICIQQMCKADALVCVSANTADCVRRELDVQPKRIHVVNNIVSSEFRPADPEERRRLKRELFGEAEFVMLHVGKPSHYKNRIGVMQVFKRLRARHPGCKLAITGVPPTEEEAAILGNTSVISGVSTHLPAGREQVRDLYCAADMLIFPSLYEGFGWPPIEAMACDCPVLSSSCGSLQEVVGDGGLMVDDPHNHDAFTDAASEILRDSALRRELIGRGRKNTLRFAKDIVLPQLADVYRQLAG
jgi:glycosyltransferase involved in cell wall biosynthesis